MKQAAIELTVMDALEKGASKEEVLEYMKTKEFIKSANNYLSMLKELD